MGCSHSVQPGPTEENRERSLSSSLSSTDLQHDNLMTLYTEKYERDGVIPPKSNPDFYRLRTYLDSAIGRAALRKYCPSEYVILLDVWAAVLLYKRDGIDRKMRHRIGSDICKKYVVSMEWSKVCIEDINDMEHAGSGTFVESVTISTRVTTTPLLAMITGTECLEHFGFGYKKQTNICSSANGCSFPLAAFDFLLKKIFITIYEIIFHPTFVSSLSKKNKVSVSIHSAIINSFNAASGELDNSSKSPYQSYNTAISEPTGLPIKDSPQSDMTAIIQQLNGLVLRSAQKNTAMNRMNVDSFVYGKVLGKGTFGLVASCMRKQARGSTGTGDVFAIKLQEKDETIIRSDEDPDRIVLERKILSDCNNPYINKLYCSFQTNKLSLMVLEFAEFGDLSGFIKANHLKCLPMDRVVFYMAELTSALVYLHAHGIIHRDIKPGNILLKKNGHIILGDFGSSLPSLVGTITNDMRFAGKHEESRNNANGGSRRSRKTTLFGKNSHKMRAHSIVGTSQYMAPEIAYLAAASGDRLSGISSYYKYTNAVDWWSVGVTAYKLLVGSRPIEDYQMHLILQHYDFVGGADEYSEVSISASAASASGSGSGGVMSAGVFSDSETNTRSRGFRYKENMLENTPQRVSVNVEKIPDIPVQDFISELLDVNFITRLGCGVDGLEKVKKHEFFEDIDWNLLDANKLDPPWIPGNDVVAAGTKPVNTIDVMMKSFSNVVGSSDRVSEYSIHANANGTYTGEAKKHVLDFERFLKSVKYQKYSDNSNASGTYSYSLSERTAYFSKWNYASTDSLLDELEF